MSKFLNEKAIRNVSLPLEYELFLELLPKTQKGALSNATYSGEGVRLLKLSSLHPPSNLDYSISEEEMLVAPCSESVMSSELYKQICKIYQQLYTGATLHFVPRTYIHSRKATLGGELLVAASYNNKHSVIASYWPGFGDSIDRLDPAMKRIGTNTTQNHFTLALQL